MAEKKKGKKRKEEYVVPGEELIEKPSKEEYTVAKWMRKNVPIKKTKFLNHNVKYFTASRAIDALLTPTSPWSAAHAAASSSTPSPLFNTRDDVVDYLHRMLEHKFFHRARKVPVSDQELAALRGGGDKKRATTTVTAGGKDEGKEEEKSGDKEGGKGGKGTDAESSVVEGGNGGGKGEQPQVEKEKRKRKVRLDMHNDQRFIDSLNAYVWIYDPIPLHYWLMGAAFVLGAIGLCLFPLWPPSVRLGVYYLSVAAAGFLVFIILLVVLRLIVFCAVWLLTMGKHHLWILPNLTEDVGFFASFWPLYKHEYKGIPCSASKKTKKKKKDKDSDAEDNDKDDETVKLINDDATSEQTTDERGVGRVASVESAPAAVGAEGRVPATGNNSESESESSQRSSTGKDFEMVDQGDLVDDEDEADEDDDEDDAHVKKA